MRSLRALAIPLVGLAIVATARGAEGPVDDLLRLAPGDPPDQARGLLLLRAQNRDLLHRLIATANAIERHNGQLIGLTSRQYGETSYLVRTFAPGTKPAEYYAVFEDSTFAWTN